jgi:F0F1-type ATP synthase membrane subunit c/vacuolar-type H+-ATPase subunit K
MRFMSTAVIISTLSMGCAGAGASGLTESVTVVAALQAKAEQAKARDRCFLYAELVNHMTDLAGRQLNSGESEEASKTLELIRGYADKIHLDISDDSRKLKNAESLMERTAYRLRDILQEASYEDRPALETTLKHLNEVQTQLMMQVFKK